MREKLARARNLHPAVHTYFFFFRSYGGGRGGRRRANPGQKGKETRFEGLILQVGHFSLLALRIYGKKTFGNLLAQRIFRIPFQDLRPSFFAPARKKEEGRGETHLRMRRGEEGRRRGGATTLPLVYHVAGLVLHGPPADPLATCGFPEKKNLLWRRLSAASRVCVCVIERRGEDLPVLCAGDRYNTYGEKRLLVV